MFQNYWGRISKIGIKKEYDDGLVRRITLTNQFSVIALALFFFSGLNNFSLGDVFSGLLLEGFVLVCLLGIYINSRHYHGFAIAFLFMVVNIALFYFNSYSGILSGTYLYYFPLILTMAFVFDIRKDKKAIFINLLLIMSLILVNLATHYSLFTSSFITDEKRYQMFVFNLLLSCLTVVFFIYLIIRNGLKESELYSQRLAEHEQAEKKIKEALAEKEVLLSELHHRVKNNLAIISGLFSLKINNDIPSEARNVLVESRNRVISMSLIHNRLYNYNNLSDVNFEQYIAELISEINASYPSISGSVKVNTDIGDVVLNLNIAVPCGLILNELLTNCYKHAFTGKGHGSIHVSFKQEKTSYTLSVSDNGVGLVAGYREKESLGMSVIEALSEQLNGSFEYTSGEGTHFTLKFQHGENIPD
jgi:two-component sensor histidine kinase